MSWDSYVNDQLLATKKVQEAIICGHDGSVWAKSAGVAPTAEELGHIAKNFGNVEVMSMSGMKLGGEKFMFLQADNNIMRGKKGTSGVHIMKTTQAILISVYREPVVAEECATVTEKLGEYLISVGY